MPMRTVLPTISITWTTTSSPIMIFSPTRRVMSSMVPPWIQLRVYGRTCSGSGRNGRGEQRGANGGLGGLVDDLVAAALADEDRSAQVRVEVSELGAGANRHEHGHVGRVGGDARGVRVGQVDGVVGEEVPGVGDRQGQRRIVDGVQPAERAVFGRGDQRVARAAEADQAV